MDLDNEHIVDHAPESPVRQGGQLQGEQLQVQGAEGGGVIPSTRRPAFELKIQADLPIPVLIAVPHAGRDYPASLLKKMRDPDYSKIRLEDRLVDVIGANVAENTGACLLISHAPRAMIDLNRATDDVDWEMIVDANPDGARHSAANRRARSGLGLVPRRLPGLGEIWNMRISSAELSARIRQVHTPYHKALSQGLAMLRDHWGAALLIDLHSMPPLKKANDQDMPAKIVIGDRFGASAGDQITASALQILAEQSVAAAHNRPYAGGYVLERHADPLRAIHAIQVELCRSLYLDDRMKQLSTDVDSLISMMTDFTRILSEKICQSSFGQSRGYRSFPQAAE